ncbi:MAG: hypothetical protein M1826_007752 [Phylliscum demangeonii]|nr:MAG: hypothetical protein M1826_007752 [Phylliscum demangeonii]
MHFQSLFVLAPLLLGPALAIPRPQVTGPRDTQAVPSNGLELLNAVPSVLGAGGLLAGGRAWYLNREAKKGLALQNERLQTLEGEILRLRGHTRDQLEIAQRQLGSSLAELEQSTQQDILHLHQRIDDLPRPSDGQRTSGAENAPEQEYNERVRDRILLDNPHIWRCMYKWIQDHPAIPGPVFVEVVEWLNGADHCDPRRLFPGIRPKHPSSSVPMYMPVPLLPPPPPPNANQFSSLAHLPARLHTAAQRSLNALAKAHLGATLLKTEKTLGREEVQAVRLGV